MGGARFCSRFCSQCRTSHEGTTGKKCQLVHQGEMGTSGASNMDSQQASISLFSDCSVDEDQAQSTAEQVVSLNGVHASVNVNHSPQNLILQELKKMSDRFGKLEEQAAEDRQVLSGLVVGFNKQGQTMDKLLSTTSVDQVTGRSSSQNRSVRRVQNSENVIGNVVAETNSVASNGYSSTQVKTHSITSPICIQSEHVANPTSTTLNHIPTHQHMMTRNVTGVNTSTVSHAMQASINVNDVRQASQVSAFCDEIHTHGSNSIPHHAATHTPHNIAQPSHSSSVGNVDWLRDEGRACDTIDTGTEEHS